MAIPIFSLSSGRSGTSYLANFFKHNVTHCTSSHEPYLTPKNPTLFGKAIEWNAFQQDAFLLPLFQKKQQYIQKCRSDFYFEANHALVKSAHRHINGLFPNALFIHLIRSPKKVAKSELLREQVIRRFHLPFIDYTLENNHKSFYWSLCGEENIYKMFAELNPAYPITRFGFYVLQWFEVEYRIQHMLKNHHAITLDVEHHLHNLSSLTAMLKGFELSYKTPIRLDLGKNKTWFAGSSTFSNEEENEYHYIISHLPQVYADLLAMPSYCYSSFSADLS